MAETIYDGPPSPGDTERALTEVAAQRDQLKQHVEELLGAVKAMEDEPFGFREEEETHLYETADRIRKELGE